MQFSYRHRFSVGRDPQGADRLLFLDFLAPSSQRLLAAPGVDLQTPAGCRAVMRMLLPPCIAHDPEPVADNPSGPDDAHFWQFPAITEKLAWQAHHDKALPPWQAALGGPVDAYLGLPWATYIDKGQRRANRDAKATGQPPDFSPWIPEAARIVFLTRMQGYQALAAHWGLQWGQDVRIHTVCQHIYWERFLPLWAKLGITDLHLSHCEQTSAAKAALFNIRVHPWHLAAANVVNTDRSMGLDPGKPWQQRRWLASFIGAHMPHYRSDLRLRLGEAVTREKRPDILFELGSNWHFNPLVYEGQTLGRALTPAQHEHEANTTRRYNEVLSDSVFSLCPEGAGPNTIRLWESLAVGSIPVVLVNNWIWPRLPPLRDGLRWEDVVVMGEAGELSGLVDRLERLRHDLPEQLTEMQSLGMEVFAAVSRQCCFEDGKP